jgi:uncharacterized SAM-binding protein YcdF (DUF218 family)
MIKRLFVIAILVFAAYAAGFVWFAFDLTDENKYPDTRTDAIIALTGERFRITSSIEELSHGRSPKLFISGIYEDAPINRVIDQTLDRLGKPRKNSLRAKIETEDKATSTLENAIETSHWIKANNIESIRLMTSFYHMPRSELIFKRYMPELVIVPHPIKVPGEGANPFESRRMFSLALSEYNKFLVVYLWDKAGLDFEILSKITKRGSR